MKKFFALLMLGFLLILVAPVQAMQSGDDCNVSYNVDNSNAPPGIAQYYDMTVCCDQNIVFENFQNNNSDLRFDLPGYLWPLWYTASARSAVILSSVNLKYYDLALTGNIEAAFLYRMPRDGLMCKPGTYTGKS